MKYNHEEDGNSLYDLGVISCKLKICCLHELQGLRNLSFDSALEPKALKNLIR